jgi:hypothetical protein
VLRKAFCFYRRRRKNLTRLMVNTLFESKERFYYSSFTWSATLVANSTQRIALTTTTLLFGMSSISIFVRAFRIDIAQGTSTLCTATAYKEHLLYITFDSSQVTRSLYATTISNLNVCCATSTKNCIHQALLLAHSEYTVLTIHTVYVLISCLRPCVHSRTSCGISPVVRT